MSTLLVQDKDGPLGTVTLNDGHLTADNYGLQQVVDHMTQRTGSAEAAYAELRDRSNGYVWATEQ